MSSKNKESFGRIDFLKYANMFMALSVVLMVGFLAYIGLKGFNFGVDFAGGTEVQVRFNGAMETGKLRSFLADMGYGSASVQSFQEGNEYLIRLDPVKAETEQQANQALNALIQKVTEGLMSAFSSEGPEIRRVDTVGPQVGSELKRNGILATFYSLLFILIYIGLRFDYKYAPSAVITIFHDTIVICGLYAIFRWEMNIQTMAAILTIIGYSLNDTIIIFDRIRENEKLFRDYDFTWICNRSVNDTLSRTILTSLTTFMAVVVMWIFAGGVIQDFAMTMAIGIIAGTYSTVYIATPLVIFMEKFEKKGLRG